MYEFTDKLQEKILAVLWRDSSAYAVYRSCIKPKYFSKTILIDLCRMIMEYYEEFSSTPTIDVLSEEVRDMVSKSKVKRELEDDYTDLIEKMAEFDLDDLEYVKKKILEFGKRQALIEAVMESADIIEKNGDSKKIRALIDDALIVGEDISDIGIRHFDGTEEERIWGYTNNEDVIERISTGKPLLDAVLKGGLGRTEMGVVVAPPGRGKTSWLIDIGAAALEQGYNVFHYSFENNELQIRRNYDTRLLKKNIDYIKENPEKSIEAFRNVKKYRVKSGELVIKKYSIKKASIDTIKAHIKQVEIMLGIKPDLIIIDYGALLKPTVSGDKRDMLESNYEDVRGLADEFNCAVWTGAQANRPSLSKKIVTIQDLAECFAIANISDFMIALCQSYVEAKAGKMRYFIAKNRDNTGYQTFAGQDLRSIRYFSIDEELKLEDEDMGGNIDGEDEDGTDKKGKSKGKFQNKRSSSSKNKNKDEGADIDLEPED